MSAAIVQLTQGSQEWLDYRKSMRNASETAAVLGISPFCTPYQLWMLKTGRSVPKTNAAMQHGTDMEAAARQAYEAHTRAVMQPLVLKDGTYSASLDGITLDWDLLVEIKCPFKGRDSALWQEATADRVPEHYRMQIQHQLMVSGADVAHLWVYDGSGGLLLPVYRDGDAILAIRQAWDGFQNHLDSDTPPPLTDADTVLREDAAWAAAATAFAEAKKAADLAETTLTQAKEALVALALHPKESGAGVAVTRFWKAGSVAYAKIPMLKGIDLDVYRGKAREEVRITCG